MNSMPPDDFLDRLLRADAARGLPDDGFSQGVLHALPGRTHPLARGTRLALILGATALGSALAHILGSPGQSLLRGFGDLFARNALTPDAAAALAMGAALALAAYALATDTE